MNKFVHFYIHTTLTVVVDIHHNHMVQPGRVVVAFDQLVDDIDILAAHIVLVALVDSHPDDIHADIDLGCLEADMVDRLEEEDRTVKLVVDSHLDSTMYLFVAVEMTVKMAVEHYNLFD